MFYIQYPRIRLRVRSNRVIYGTVVPIVTTKFKPNYAEQRLLGLDKKSYSRALVALINVIPTIFARHILVMGNTMT